MISDGVITITDPVWEAPDRPGLLKKTFGRLIRDERDLPFQHLSASEWATYDQTLEIDCSQQTAATIVVRIRGTQ